MTITTKERDSNIIILLPNKFDFSVQSDFRHSYEGQKDGKNRHYILDFSAVRNMDSSALGMMLLLHDFVSDTGRTNLKTKIKIQYCDKSIKSILEIANFHNFFDIS
jgi:anti-anti-sigma regulatory factor